MSETDVNYNAFHDPDVGESNQTLKLNSKKSRYAKTESQPGPTAQEFDQAVSDYNSKDLDFTNKIAELAVQYRTCVTDKTLKNNQSPIKKDFENKVIRELTDLGLALNNDQNKPEGIGSMGMISMLMQTVLTQRDQINQLSFNVETLRKELAKLNKEEKSSGE